MSSFQDFKQKYGIFFYILLPVIAIVVLFSMYKGYQVDAAHEDIKDADKDSDKIDQKIDQVESQIHEQELIVAESKAQVEALKKEIEDNAKNGVSADWYKNQ